MKGFPVNRQKTEYTKYHVSTISLQTKFDTCSAAIDKDINNTAKAVWIMWRALFGVLCDTRVPIQIKGSVYKQVLLYGSELGYAHNR